MVLERQRKSLTMPDRSGASTKNLPGQGNATREAILRKAVEISSMEGLESLSIGQLAAALRMSKSGLFAHFGSKEELQCATVDKARDMFIDEVIRPALSATGLKRLRMLCDRWLSYVERRVFPGGCFFCAASLEFDDRPGVVRDRIVQIEKQWLSLLEKTVREAQAAGQLEKAVDSHQLTFEINAIAMGANWSFRLLHDNTAFSKAKNAILSRIDQAARPGKRKSKGARR